MKKTIQILFFILLTIIFAVILLLFEAKFRVLTPQFAQKQLSQNNVYEKVVQNADIFVDEYIKSQQEKGKDEEGSGDGPSLSFISIEISDFIKRNIDPVWFKSQFESISNQVYAFVFSDKQQVEFRVDVSGLRSNFETEIDNYAKSQFEKLPEVSEQEFEEMMKKEKLPKARPKGISFEDVLKRIPENPIEIFKGKIPVTIKATTQDFKKNPKGNEFLSSIENFRLAKKVSDIIFYTALLIVLCLIILFAKLTSHTIGNFFLKVGLFLLPGFLLFVVFFVLRLMENFLISTFVMPNIKNAPEVLIKEIALPVLRSSYKNITGDLMLWSFVLGFIGFLIILPSLYDSKKK